jgi:hypothetical protein
MSILCLVGGVRVHAHARAAECTEGSAGDTCTCVAILAARPAGPGPDMGRPAARPRGLPCERNWART